MTETTFDRIKRFFGEQSVTENDTVVLNYQTSGTDRIIVEPDAREPEVVWRAALPPL